MQELKPIAESDVPDEATVSEAESKAVQEQEQIAKKERTNNAKAEELAAELSR